MKRILLAIAAILLCGYGPQQASSVLGNVAFRAPLTDVYMQPSSLPSDLSGYAAHATSTNGTPVFSSTGMASNRATSDTVRFPTTGFDGAARVSIGFRFTPTDAADNGEVQYFFDCTVTVLCTTGRLGSGFSNALRIRWANTVIEDIPFATYGSYWNVGIENTMVITSDSTGDTDVWLNGVQILADDPTTWVPQSPGEITIGGTKPNNPSFAYEGTQREYVIWDEIITAAKREAFEDGVHP